jgi:hypothetical protein
VKREVPTTFKIKEEVKRVLITFVVKEETKEFEETIKPNMNDIPKLVQENNASIQTIFITIGFNKSTFLKVPSYVLVVTWVVGFLFFHHSHLEIHSHSMHVHN